MEKDMVCKAESKSLMENMLERTEGLISSLAVARKRITRLHLKLVNDQPQQSSVSPGNTEERTPMGGGSMQKFDNMIVLFEKEVMALDAVIFDLEKLI